MSEARALIHAAVHRIPKGRVATYGQIARVAGLPGRARLVGRVMSELPAGTTVPWHRVVNAAGAISPRSEADSPRSQRARLLKEGVAFTRGGKIPLARFQWKAGADPAAESFRRLG